MKMSYPFWYHVSNISICAVVKGESLEGDCSVVCIGCSAVSVGVADENGKELSRFQRINWLDLLRLRCFWWFHCWNYMAVKGEDTSFTEAWNDILWSESLHGTIGFWKQWAELILCDDPTRIFLDVGVTYLRPIQLLWIEDTQVKWLQIMSQMRW